jgi:hypothetical protein
VVSVLLNSTQAPSGFRSQYQDQIPNADQAHHFAAFFQLGFVNGADIGSWLAKVYEQGERTPDNSGDINLGRVAAQMGAAVAAGDLDPSDLASAILNTLCN